MPRPIPIVSDIPSVAPQLGFGDYVDALSDAIRGAAPAQLTMGLYGPWGSGKSTLLGAIERELALDDDVLVVRFDAWRYERSEHIVVPLLHAVAKASSAAPSFMLVAHQLRRFLLSLVNSLSYKIPFGPTIDGARLADSLSPNELDRLDEAFSRPFEELRGIPACLGSRRIVVLVDDLDRCSPDKVVGLLEAINLIMDIEGFVFVLALDYEVLVAAVRQKYPHVSGHFFIEKMIQLPFRVPPLPATSSTLMNHLIPNWTSFVSSHTPEVVDALSDVASTALRGNPRQIKRLVNYILLLERIVENRSLQISGHSLLAVVALQLAWPDEYRMAQEAVQDGGETPLLHLAESDVPALARFAARHLTQFEDLDLLTRTFQLTAAVESAPESKPLPTPQLQMRSTKAEARNEAENSLRAVGWFPTSTSSEETFLANASRRLLQIRLTNSRIFVDLQRPAASLNTTYEFSETLAELPLSQIGEVLALAEIHNYEAKDYRRWAVAHKMLYPDY